ncbi:MULTISPECIES: sensor histidine kinase [unclassified Crossiella]|uniref:sensor histidine kinase n=1 Tax=unclassified Crossiella TaxID=2620835 RepID=UPI001FFF41D6|nr:MULTISPECIES: sensor histidine kinase [unclassified Crossiella]MCK2238840.1 sensor histidine kinase [Crossiella sp. S99.2]MCK2251590.1 sensor histidine kinase [Crossiella sp. S99.1]
MLTRRPLLTDAALAVLVVIAVSAPIIANTGRTGQPSPLAFAFVGVLAGLMFLRRRYPVLIMLLSTATLIGYYTLELPPIGLAVPLAAPLYSAAEQGRTRAAIGVAAAVMVISTVARLGEGDDPAYVLGLDFGGWIALFAAVIALGDAVRSRRGWRAELAKQARAAEQEREREAAARVEQERLRIARDLHDLLAHTVAVISLHTDVARETLREDPDRAERSLTAARTACSEVVQELRATLGALRAGESDPDAPVPGLARLSELTDSATTAGLTVRVHTEGTPSPLPALADATAYRVLQEALSNIRRHAAARTVEITLTYRPEHLHLSIRDDGQGPSATTDGGGWGIMGMRERLALLGGELRTSAPSRGGFLVEAQIPVRGRP